MKALLDVAIVTSDQIIHRTYITFEIVNGSIKHVDVEQPALDRFVKLVDLTNRQFIFDRSGHAHSMQELTDAEYQKYASIPHKTTRQFLEIVNGNLVV